MLEMELEPQNEVIKKYEKTNIKMFKAGSGKSVTMVILKADFPENSEELVLNVSLKGLKEYLSDERFKVFSFNRLRNI